MKRCPKCNLTYTDHTLEFCLEDGSRLVFVASEHQETPTVTIPNKPFQVTDKTTDLPFSNHNQTPNFQAPNNNDLHIVPKTVQLKEKAVEQGNKVLEIAPIVISLAHNWWQWIYLNNQYYSSFSGYVLSANFLMWLLLLIAGLTVSLFSIKRSQNKGFAIVSLVVLAINLLLILVPKR